MKWFNIFAVIMILLGMSQPVMACEPIVPLIQLFSGTLLIGQSVLALLAAIVIKIIAFLHFDKTLPRWKAAAFLFLANLVSSLVGFLLAISASGATLLFSLAIVYLLSLKPAKRLVQYAPWGYFRKWSANVLAFLVTLLFVSTFVLFGLAQGVIAANASLKSYWMLKFFYVYTALLISIGLTTLWEEWIVALLARRTAERSPFLPAVLKANLVTFLVIMSYAAVRMLPARLKSGDFLVQLIGAFN